MSKESLERLLYLPLFSLNYYEKGKTIKLSTNLKVKEEPTFQVYRTILILCVS